MQLVCEALWQKQSFRLMHCLLSTVCTEEIRFFFFFYFSYIHLKQHCHLLVRLSQYNSFNSKSYWSSNESFTPFNCPWSLCSRMCNLHASSLLWLDREDTWHCEVAGWMREDYTTLIWAGGVCRGFVWRVIARAVDRDGVLSCWHGGGRSNNVASIYWSKILRLSRHTWAVREFELGARLLTAQNIRSTEVHAWFFLAHAFTHMGMHLVWSTWLCHFNSILIVWQTRLPRDTVTKLSVKEKYCQT